MDAGPDVALEAAPAHRVESGAPPAAPPALARLGRLVLLQLLLSAAFIIYFSRLFDYGERVIVLHACVVWLGLLALTATLSVVAALAPAALARSALALVPPVFVALLLALYGADLLSNRFWGHNVTYELALRYAGRPMVLARYVSVVAGWGTVLAAAAVATLAAVYLVRSTVAFEGITALVALVRRLPVKASLGAAALVTAFPVAAGLAVTLPLGHAARSVLLERDPIIGFFVDGESAHQFALSRFATRYRDEGPAVRASYQASPAFDRRNVVLIVVDSLRADHMSLYGYPRPTTPYLERLAAGGGLRQVDLALASCPESNCGISSIMASKTFGSMVAENFKLHELLRDQGYEVYFVLSGDHKWIGLRQFYGDELSLYFDGHSSTRYEPADDRVLFEGLERVPSSTGQPAFFFFHLMSAHEVGLRLDPYVTYTPSRPNGFWGGNRTMRVNSYDNGVRQADAMIEQLFTALDDKGYLSNALVVIVSDHGEGLGERPGDRGFGHGALLYQEFLRIPFLVYDPSSAAYANLSFATHVDVAPTIAHRLGLPVPSSWEGRSLLTPGVKPYSYHYVDRALSVHAPVPFYAVVQPTPDRIYKYIRQPNAEELFDLAADPHERTNLIHSEPASVIANLKVRLSEVLASATP